MRGEGGVRAGLKAVQNGINLAPARDRASVHSVVDTELTESKTLHETPILRLNKEFTVLNRGTRRQKHREVPILSIT